jgi:hypothetical protein
MTVTCKLVLGGLVGLLLAVHSPAQGQSHGRAAAGPASNGQTQPRGNCHLHTGRALAPNRPLPTYRPGYTSDQALIQGFGINVQRGIPATQVDVQRLRTPHVIGVLNGQGGFDHSAAAGPLPGGRSGIRQAFDTDPKNYQQQFRTMQEFLNQTVRYGGQVRQPYQGNPNRVQVFCPGGSCPQHR